MALQKSTAENIPKNAVILSREDAFKFQIKVLKDWKYHSDVWPFHYGGTILASLSALTGIYINNYYRTRFRLLHHGRVASYLPLCVLPGVMSFLFHTEFVLPGVVLQDECAVCTEIRSSAYQAFTGCIFPLLVAPASIFSLALRYNTYDIPYLGKEPMKAFLLWKKHTNPISNILFAIFIGHALAGTAITYFEAKAVEKVNDKLTLLGYDLDNPNY